tara:strand:- start:2738 stop:5578 length:2841 start_codon:yes stop_codon:yes gene_type:complete
MSKILFYFILFSFLYPNLIQHSNIKKTIEYNAIKVEALINHDLEKIKNVILYYKSNNQTIYLQKDMLHSKDNFFYTIIPKEYVTTNGINYYILLELINNSVYSFPYDNPKKNPINIQVDTLIDNKRTKNQLNNEGIEILSPAPNSRVYKEDLLISLSYFKLKNIDHTKTKVLLNNRDITDKIIFYDNYFIYKPSFILDGRYNIQVIFFDKYNRKLPVFKWEFTVISKDRLQGLSTLFSHNGKITNSYSTNNTGFEKLSTNNSNIDYRVNFDFLKIRNKFKISSESNQFEQDKNRYLVSIKAPYINLQLGDSYPLINQYVLNGYRIRGMNLKIDSKFFDTQIIQGELVRSVIGDPNSNALVISDINSQMVCIDQDGNEIEIITEELCCTNGCGDGLNQWVSDDSQYIIDFSRDNYAFKRNIYGFDLGIGNPEYMFFNLGFVKAKDNLNTLEKISNNMPNYTIEIPDELIDSLITSDNYDNFKINVNGCDTTYSILYNDLINNWNSWYDNYSYNLLSENWIGSKPQDNFIINSNFQLSLDEKNIILNFGSSLSLLNQDIWYPTLSINDIDVMFDDNEDGMIMEDIQLPSDINFSDYEDIFKFSINQTPLLPIDLTSDDTLFEKIITMPSLAYNLDFTFKYFSHNLNIGIKQIGPEYYSLANPYLQADIREQYINDKFRILNNRLFINYSFKRIEDGIEIDKKALSKTDKYNIALSYYSGYNLPNYSLSLKLINRDNGVDSLDIFTYQEPGHEGESGADEFGYMTISDTTNRRESTSGFQTNFSISYDYKYYGSHNFLFNISQSKKKDLLYNININYDSTYFSPRSLNQTLVVNIKSKWSQLFSSNISFNYNYYDYGNNTYYQKQVLRQIDLKGYYYRLKIFNNIQFGSSFGWANGYLKYYQFNPILSIKFEVIKNLFFDLNYQYRYRRMGNNQVYNSSFFFIKTSYNF